MKKVYTANGTISAQASIRIKVKAVIENGDWKPVEYEVLEVGEIEGWDEVEIEGLLNEEFGEPDEFEDEEE